MNEEQAKLSWIHEHYRDRDRAKLLASYYMEEHYHGADSPVTQLAVALFYQCKEIERLRQDIQDAIDALVWAGGLADAGDAEVIDNLPETVMDVAHTLIDSLNHETAVPE